MRFKFHSRERGFRKGLLFLSGRGKSYSSWNETSTGKVIDLEVGFRERVQTCLVEFEGGDLEGYEKLKTGNSIENDSTMDELVSNLDPKVKWVVMASSMGAYFASLLPESLLSGVILIDPVTTLSRADFKVPVRVHLKLDQETEPNFEFWDRITAYHSRSAVIVHWGASHLIHWGQPGKIRASIEVGLLK